MVRYLGYVPVPHSRPSTAPAGPHYFGAPATAPRRQLDERRRDSEPSRQGTLGSLDAASHSLRIPVSVTMAGSASSTPRPRRKAVKKPTANVIFPVDQHLSKADALVRSPTFPLAAFLWPARGSASQWEILPLILMVVGLFRWAAGFWGYSGSSRQDCERAQ